MTNSNLISRIRFLARRLSSGKAEVVVFTFLAISPVGAPLIGILYSLVDWCSGALGSGIECNGPFFNEYVAAILLCMELSVIFLVLPFLVWVVLAAYIWLRLLRSVARELLKGLNS